MKYSFIVFSLTSFLLASCSGSSTKEKINKAGDVAGQAMGEFGKGVANGVTKAFDIKIDLPKALSDKGLKLGKITLSHDSTGTDNLLMVYMIFDQDLIQQITAKAFDGKGLEMGRAAATVTGKKNEAKFIEFHFDKRTSIDSDSKITLE